MRKIVIGITGIFALLLAGSLASNADAQTCNPPKMLLNISGTWYCVSTCPSPKKIYNKNGTWVCQ
jgi:hypothetical protein